MWDDGQQQKRDDQKHIRFLKSKGWKVSKSRFGHEEYYAKHPEHGMTTLEDAVKFEKENV